jgi:hypothetical protein
VSARPSIVALAVAARVRRWIERPIRSHVIEFGVGHETPRFVRRAAGQQNGRECRDNAKHRRRPHASAALAGASLLDYPELRWLGRQRWRIGVDKKRH